MKQDGIVSKFLNLHARKLSKASPNNQVQCEVIAIAPETSKTDDKAEKKPSFALHKDFKDFRALLDRLNEAGELSTKAGASTIARFNKVRDGEHVMVVGTGSDREGINQLGGTERLRRLGAQVFHKLSAEKIREASIYLDTFLIPAAKLGIDAEEAAYAFTEGAGLAAYRFDKYFSKSQKRSEKEKTASAKTPNAFSDEKLPTIALVSQDSGRAAAFTRGIEQAEAMLTGTYLCRDLSNEPSNELFPEEFGERAKKLAAAYGLKATVLDEKQITKEKMGLLAGVGQGSSRPPRLIVLEYNPGKKPGKKAPKTVAFVGKGVTFDSGGISIKPSAKMEDMKHDMSGSAAVVGGIIAAAKLGLNIRILTVVAAAENMPSGDAIQPGNILTARNGKTVEIVNTDAEGRLVLGDALDYVQDMNPDYVIDLATLTGAATITLGKMCSGLMGNDAAFNRIVHAAAKASGERVWELPLFDEYFDDLRSEYADMRNSGDSPSHGTAKGAMFLKEFIRKDTRWAHLDIASVAYGCGFLPYNPKKSSSGYGVRLLVELAKKL